MWHRAVVLAVLVGLLSCPFSRPAGPKFEASLSQEKQSLRALRTISVDVTLDEETYAATILEGATAHEAASAFLSQYLADHTSADFPMEMVHSTLTTHFVKKIVADMNSVEGAGGGDGARREPGEAAAIRAREDQEEHDRKAEASVKRELIEEDRAKLKEHDDEQEVKFAERSEAEARAKAIREEAEKEETAKYEEMEELKLEKALKEAKDEEDEKQKRREKREQKRRMVEAKKKRKLQLQHENKQIDVHAGDQEDGNHDERQKKEQEKREERERIQAEQDE
eukprot:g1485.t1